MNAEQMRETYNLAYDHAYNGDDSPVGDDLRHEAGLAAVAADAKDDALVDAMSIYEQICCDGGEINYEEDNYAAGFAHGAYAFNEAIRSRLPHTEEAHA